MKAPMKVTRQRRAILEALQESKQHPTADEVYSRVRKQMPRISLGTVYRNLDLMAERGMITRLAPGENGRRHYDANSEPHAHVRCLRCGKMEDVDETAGIDWQRLTGVTDYQLTGCRVELTGLCPECREND